MPIVIDILPWRVVDLDQSASFIDQAWRSLDPERPTRTQIEIRVGLTDIYQPLIVLLAKEDDQWLGWLLTSAGEYNDLLLNPGFLGGYPVIGEIPDRDTISKYLLEKAVDWAIEGGFHSVQMIVPLINTPDALADEEKFLSQMDLLPRLRYVSMTCKLTGMKIPQTVFPGGFQVLPLENAQTSELQELYLEAFNAGDARFFFMQTGDERIGFFQTLGYGEALAEPGSVILRDGDRLVAFVYVIPYGDSNRHISCMCVHPDLQGQGLGKALLYHVMNAVHDAGLDTISLGTETEMRAFHLYHQNGFMIQEGSTVYEWRHPDG
jgi:ribosomal protein S18 acetylase RimI-like enzyme